MQTKDVYVLVGLDLSKMDAALIEYLHIAQGFYPLAHFIFLHNVKLNELPASLKKPEVLAEIRSEIHKKILAMVTESGLKESTYSVEVEMENFSEHAFLKVGKRVNANLVVLGNKQNLAGNGGLPLKLIRMWQVATMLVPETFRPNPQKITKAIDFSKYTPVINRIADQIIVHNQFGIEHAEAIYVSRVAWQFFPGPGPEELAKMVEDQSRARKERWKKEYPREKDLTVLSTTTESIATVISNYLTENQTDLVIMGVLGASSLTGLFMGSVTNEILSLPTSTTILLVKRQVTA